MPPNSRAARAYEIASAHRNPKVQEADVFRRVNASLRRTNVAGLVGPECSRAIADTDRLWVTVIDLVRDPSNGLPHALRASIASIGAAVRRECCLQDPDIEFLIAVNDAMADGLSGPPGKQTDRGAARA